MGVHIQTELTIPICGDKGEEASAGDPDQRELLRDQVTFQVIPGVGVRSQRTQAVAKRAGVPVGGYSLMFEVRLKSEVGVGVRVRVRVRARARAKVRVRVRVTVGGGEGDC